MLKRILVNRVTRLAIKLVICCLLLLIFLLDTSFLTVFPHAVDLSNNQAGLVAQFDDGSIETRCVQFSEESISGYELLVRSEIPFVAAFSSLGAAICKIREDGCSQDNCFCQSPPDYWSYWHLDGDEWVYSVAGASSSQVVDGSVEGWRWGPGLPPGKVIPFETICAQPSETPTSGYLTNSDTPTISPSPTFNNASTPTPTVTKSPTPSSTFVWIAVSTNAPLVVVQLPTETIASASPTVTPSPVTPSPFTPTSTTTPTSKPTSTPTASFTPTSTHFTTLSQTTQVNPTDTPEIRETAIPNDTPLSLAEQKRKLENTPTPTRRQGFQKPQSTALALSPAFASTVEGEGLHSRPGYARLALLTGGMIVYFVFLLILGGLAAGLVIAWVVKRK